MNGDGKVWYSSDIGSAEGANLVIRPYRSSDRMMRLGIAWMRRSCRYPSRKRSPCPSVAVAASFSLDSTPSSSRTVCAKTVCRVLWLLPRHTVVFHRQCISLAFYHSYQPYPSSRRRRRRRIKCFSLQTQLVKSSDRNHSHPSVHMPSRHPIGRRTKRMRILWHVRSLDLWPGRRE